MSEVEPERILAADIGGTKTILALCTLDGERLVRERQQTYASRDHPTFGEILEDFLPRGGLRLRSACFDVAGPVLDGECRTTNLPWYLAEKELSESLDGAPVRLLNDLEATAFGMLHLPADELVVLQPGMRSGRRGNVAVIAAGTGLGEAYLYWDGRHHFPMASEGGHADFAPRTDREVELLAFLRERFHGRVSSERILSGPGVVAVYEFLREHGGAREDPATGERIAAGDAAAVISQAAQGGADPLASAAMELFFELYGAEAGNMALRGLTHGGVFVGGGIAPKNLELIRGGAFLRGFRSKGRFQEFMEGLQVSVSLNPETALLGAARFALQV